MERKQLLILITIGLTTGGFFEAMKTQAAQTSHIHNLARLEHMLEEGKIVYDPNAKDDRAPKELARVAHAPPPPPAGAQTFTQPPAQIIAMNDMPIPAVTAGPIAKPLPADAKKKAEEEKKKADEKKKKDKEDAQKAEDAKATEEAQNNAAPSASPTPTPDAQNNNGTPQPANVPATPNYASSAAATTNTNSTAASGTSAAEWEAQLMNSPESSKTAAFVKAYKAGTVKKNVFYEVVQAMLNDNLATVQEQGISALTATPSAESFTLLADTESKSSDTTVKSQSEAGVNAYATSGNVGNLTSVITGSDATAALAAIDVIQQLASSNGSASATATSTSGSTASTALTANALTSLQTSLQNAESRSTNANVRSAAAQALTEVQGLLSQTQVSLNP